MRKLFTTRNMVMIAAFTALATVLAYFPHIHMTPSPVMEIEFSDLPVFVCAYFIHPVCGILVAFFKSLFHLAGTESMGIGEALTFVQAVVFILPTFFHRKVGHIDLAVKTIVSFALNFLLGLAAGGLVIVPVMNYLCPEFVEPSLYYVVIIPYYAVRSAVIAATSYLLCLSVYRPFVRDHLIFSLQRRIDISKPFVSKSDRETYEYARVLAETLQDGEVLELSGDLGAGKTTLTKGIAKAYGIDPSQVLSPTFVLCRSYEGTRRLHHADLYRVASAEEVIESGVLEHIGDGVFVIEWADVVRELLPPHKTVFIEKLSKNKRKMEIRS